MNKPYFGTIVIITLVVLVGCSNNAAVPATSASTNTYTSQILTTSYPGALSASDQLMLGTLRLEETEQAVTAEQAKVLLPLWQALQGSALKAEAERSAVYAQIEATMTPAQLEAIAAMQLTQEALAQGQGGPPGMEPGGGQPPSSSEMATRQVQFSGMSDEQRQAMRATAQAGGGFGGAGGFGGGAPCGGQSGAGGDAQRQAMRATAQAGGGFPGGTRGTGGSRQGGFMLGALIRLLSQRAGLDIGPVRNGTRVPAPAMTPTP